MRTINYQNTKQCLIYRVTYTNVILGVNMISGEKYPPYMPLSPTNCNLLNILTFSNMKGTIYASNIDIRDKKDSQ